MPKPSRPKVSPKPPPRISPEHLAQMPDYSPSWVRGQLQMAERLGRNGRRAAFKNIALARRRGAISWAQKKLVDVLEKKYGSGFLLRPGAITVLFDKWRLVLGKLERKGLRSLTTNERAVVLAVYEAYHDYLALKQWNAQIARKKAERMQGK